MPLFKLQIVDREGKVAILPGGGELERDLIQLFTKHIVEEITWNRTQKAIEIAIRSGIEKAILELKSETYKAL